MTMAWPLNADAMTSVAMECGQKSWALNSSCRPSPTAAIVASNLRTPEATQIGLEKSETRLVEF
jgi:hypothetical protein